jgi:exosortase/archaeosortase
VTYRALKSVLLVLLGWLVLRLIPGLARIIRMRET